MKLGRTTHLICALRVQGFAVHAARLHKKCANCQLALHGEMEKALSSVDKDVMNPIKCTEKNKGLFLRAECFGENSKMLDRCTIEVKERHES